MQKLILSLCFSIALLGLSAQEASFLEIKISESFQVAPTAFEYHLNVTLEAEGEDYDLDRDYRVQRKAMQARIKENEAQLKQFLDNNNIKYTLQREGEYLLTTQREVIPTLYRIKVSNKTELEKLLTTLRQLSYIHGRVENKTFPDGDQEEVALFEKMYTRARQKAEKMAAMMNCALGKILAVQHLDDRREDFYEQLNEDMYEQIPLNPTPSDPLNLRITKSLLFRFELIRK
jgi:hypothetical protein